MKKVTCAQINSLRIAGTDFDRRRKLSNSDKEEIKRLFNCGISGKAIAEKFGISYKNIYRYKDNNYEKYLKSQTKYQKTYNESLDVDELAHKRSVASYISRRYKQRLLEVKECWKA